MSTPIHDLRVSLRQLASNPGFAVTAILCLALGIGANTAVFSFVNGFLFRTPPYEEPERLVRVYTKWASGLDFGSVSYPDFADLRDDPEIFADLAAESPLPLSLSAGDRSERVWGAIVSGNYFDLLGITLPVGRSFLPEEDATPGSHAVVVLSHDLWQDRFGGSPSILDESLTLNGRPFRVIGVAPPGFQGSMTGIGTDLWLPMMMQEVAMPGLLRLDRRGSHWISSVIGRLKPGRTVEQTAAALDARMAELTETYPDSNTGKKAILIPEGKSALHPMVRDGFVAFLGLMFVVVGIVLLLACANVAGLLLARASGRRREIAVRLALGAGRGQLVRQLLTESLLLSVVGGAVGLLLAFVLVRGVSALQPPVDIPLELALGIDANVLVFTFAASLVTGLLFGLLPALQSTRPQLVPSLKDGTAGSGRGSSRLRQLLVAAQVAISLVLLVGAGLALRSLANARSIPLGFEPSGQLLASFDLGLQGYGAAEAGELFDELVERVRALPGVEHADYGEFVPLSLGSRQNGAVPEGYVVPAGENPPSIDYNIVSPDYFAAMGTPLLEGRAFRRDDDEDSPYVLIVNEAFARRFFPDEGPIGKRVETFGDDPHRIVGVVPTGKYFSLGEDPKPFMYGALEQHPRAARTLHVRTAGNPAALSEPLRRLVRELDPNLAVFDLETMSDHLKLVLLPSGIAAVVISAFALLALLLAAVGLYGVISYWVSQGTREIGIRLALGARSTDVLKMVVGRGATLAGIGLAGGLAVGYLLSRLASSILYGVTALEPVAYVIAVLVLASVATTATLLPARRATRVDPVRALRAE